MYKPYFSEMLNNIENSEYVEWLDKVDVVEIVSGFVTKYSPSPLGKGSEDEDLHRFYHSRIKQNQ